MRPSLGKISGPTATLAVSLGLGLGLLAGGCASTGWVTPSGGYPEVKQAAGGAELTVFASEWVGEPDDLGDYVTPVAVELVNNGQEPLRVSYFDFVLTDDHGFRYAALNPFVNAQTSALDSDPPPAGPMLAWRGGGGVRVGGGVRMGPPMGGGMRAIPAPRPRVMGVPSPVPHGSFGAPHVYAPTPHMGVVPRGVYRHGGVVIGAPAWRGYSVLPFYRPFYGAGYGYWASPFLWPPGYATWVWAWGPSFYPSPTPPSDVVQSGLPEGVLEPGGHVSGFLYFQRIHEDAKQLGFSWNVAEAHEGQARGEARVSLEVKR